MRVKEANDEEKRKRTVRRLFVLLVSAVMALTLIAVAAGVSAAAPNQQQPGPKEYYLVLSYSPGKDCCFWSTGTTKASATRASVAYCKQQTKAKDCRLGVWVRNGYVAVAESANTTGVAYGRTAQEATKKALTNCERPGPACKPVGTAKTALDKTQKTTGGYK